MNTPANSSFRSKKQLVLDKIAATGASTRSVKQQLRELSGVADEVLRQLWSDAQFPSDCALLAVGGYGRGELFPHSDIDVLILLPDSDQMQDDEHFKTSASSFITACWDAGLEIGSSVRSVSECVSEAEKDVTVQTSLLESRLLTGDAALHKAFSKAYRAALDPQAFFTAKTLEAKQRHTKFEDTPYSLEPNCKESPGGLRDLQLILWLTKAAGYGKSWDDLARKGLATAREVRELKRNEAVLSLVRARLHIAAKRREDRLVFDLQHLVAESFGYLAEGESRSQRKASEQLMKRYYWAAKAVTQLAQILLLNIEERLFEQNQTLHWINERFADKAGMIEVTSDELYLNNPHAILETFHIYQTTVGVKGLSARTLRALYNARGIMNAGFRKDPANREMFRKILQSPQGITHATRLMNQTSVLGRYLWVFRKIVGQMQHDLFHVYTVDQHILMVLRNVRRFFMAEHTHEYPFCSQLAAGWDKPWILYTAALFHDIAKGRGGDHSDLGAMEVKTFCREHGISKEDAQLIAFLVQHHLVMSSTAQKQDLSDPDVITAFAKKVGNERYLTALYLLTVADIRGTSPKVWNAWKGKLLEDLYKLTLRTLGGRAPDAGAEVQERKTEALQKMALYAMPHEAEKALWSTLEVSYFLRHDANDIAWHARQLSRHVDIDTIKSIASRADSMPANEQKESENTTKTAIVRSRLSPIGEGIQVLVYTPDQSDLFARICGFFDSEGFSILDARVHTANNGYALDTFQVISNSMGEHHRELMQMIEAELPRVLAAQEELPPPAKSRVSRRVKSFPVAPRVSLAPDEKAQRWLLTVSCSDRSGLLYSIARILAKHRINLQLAKVMTLGERVEDNFLIDGAELQHNKKQIEIETELLEVLGS
ncbi:[protein-PII] uridylyltransferase [Variovorax sp. PCZ-1]|uniref:[protein-PII] uridylyltransferase n=1 Tax=Variovorax sp. PCZ-1 TaxID=2835533 RepID=UPI001BCDB9CC|nr:[protein-PII] uridylyltransferase [Variovorax sp. PCZ-1]MBS7809168.1 [protein-PII] uridylyltransferase [Variovorax sp. PCZ-1]